MNRMKSHGVKFTDTDWSTLEALAFLQGMNVNNLIHRLCKAEAEKYERTWQGAQKVGRPPTKKAG